MKVRLKIQTGIITGAIDIPEHCLNSDYRLPLHKPMTAKLISQVQDMIVPQTTNEKCLVFRWDRKTYWGNSRVPIMSLEDYY